MQIHICSHNYNYFLMQSCVSVLSLCDPLSMGFSRQEYWSGLPCPPPGDLVNPGIKSTSPTLQADCLPSEPPGKPKNTRVGSLSLLHGNFPTQESNQGLLHSRQILYQLSSREAPTCIYIKLNRSSF